MAEIEAKFIIRRPEQVAAVLRALSANRFSVEDHGMTAHVDRYFDTEDWSILAAGWACRVRRRNGGATLTLKSLQGPDRNIFIREEVSQSITDEDAELSLSLPPGPVRDRLVEFIDDKPVMELFRLASERTVYVIASAGLQGVQVELDLDRSRIEAEKRTEKATGVLEFTELELELLSGELSDLESIASLLRDGAGLMQAKFSKFERGLQAAGLEMDLLTEKPRATSLTEDDPALALLYQYVSDQLQIIQRHHPRALEGIDPEGVHQMRVASRRLRAILKAFRGILGDEVVVRFNGELRWLAQNLGRARDADVTEMSARDSEEPDAGHYERFLAEETVNAYEHLVDVLESERCSTLEKDLAQFSAAGPGSEIQEQFGKLSIADCADQLIHAALGKLLEQGDAITADSAARELHKLRIRAKRFRYLLDFFSSVQAEKWFEMTEALKRLQDILGEHQDAVTARAQLADYAASLPTDAEGREKLAGTARLMRAETERIATSRQQFSTAWSDFKNTLI
jgi:triphosphatase